MKKLIALALVLVMALSMTTVAFAANDLVLIPGDDFTIDPDDFFCDPGNTTNKTQTSSLTAIFGGSDSSEAEKYFTDDNFKIIVKFGKGRDLVESYKFDNGKIKVTMKASTTKATNIPNFEVTDFYVQAKKDINQYNGSAKIKRNEKFIYDYDRQITDKANPNVLAIVGWPETEKKVGDEIDVSGNASKQLIKFGKNGTDTYDTSVFKFGDWAYGEMRVYDGDKFFLSYNTDVNVDVLKKNPDADITFVNLMGNFNAAMNFELYADEDAFVYELKDGKLAPTKLEWNKDAYAWTGKVRTLGTYVISDEKLTNLVIEEGKEEETKNPNTGANDVVGVAVALAVVSLVAAGAVSLKK